MENLDRRDTLKTLAALGAGAAAGAWPRRAAPADEGRRNVIQRENELPGTRDWMLRTPRIDPATKYRCPWIEGYCSHPSIRAGETISFHVSTNPKSQFTLDIYRLGYYGGLGGRLMSRLGPFDGTVQPDPPVGKNRLRVCAWEPCAALRIPEDWISGVYVGKLTADRDGVQSYVIFIVRDDREADLLFQCSDSTWQAYNRWPSQFSLYDNGVHQWYWGGDVLVSRAADGGVGPVAMLAADRFCHDRQALLLVDPPARWRSVNDAIADQRRSDFHSSNAVTWYPGARLRDESSETLLTSATGAVAASLAEMERTRGVSRLHDEPPVLVRGALTPVCDVSPEDVRRLARAGINSLARRSALHLQLLGNVTQSRHAGAAGSDCLDERCEALFIMRRVRQSTRWVAGYDSCPRVWREVRQQVADFLNSLHAQGRLRGPSSRDAWFVRCDAGTNAANEGVGGVTTLYVGVALVQPGVFHVMRFQHTPSRCIVTEQEMRSQYHEAV